MKNSHQYMKVTTQETLYHEYHGATLKHKCGKRIVTLSLLSFLSFFFTFFIFLCFSLFLVGFFGLFFYLGFFGLFFIWASLASFIFLSTESHPNLWGNHSLHRPFLTWGNALIMMIITLLFTYNSLLQLDVQNKV